MAEFCMTKLMEAELDKFLSTKTITDVDRTSYIPLALFDGCNKLTTCLMFNCNCHSYEDPTIIPCEYTGAVVHLPAFWVEVPKELAMTYLKDIVNQLYKGTYKDWKDAGYLGRDNGGTDSGNGSGCGCPCGPTGGWVNA